MSNPSAEEYAAKILDLQILGVLDQCDGYKELLHHVIVDALRDHAAAAVAEERHNWRHGDGHSPDVCETCGCRRVEHVVNAELLAACKAYQLAQRRMLDRYSDGDERVKNELWRNLHGCELAATRAIANAEKAGVEEKPT